MPRLPDLPLAPRLTAGSPSRRIAVLRPLAAHPGPAAGAALIARAAAGEAVSVNMLMLAGGYVSLGEATLTDAALPKSQAGDLIIDQDSGWLYASTGQDHRILSRHLLKDLTLCDDVLQSEEIYTVRFQTRAITALTGALMALFDDPADAIADRLRTERPFGMAGQAIHRLTAQVADTAGRINMRVQHGHAPASHAVQMSDLLTRIAVDPTGA